MTEHPVSVRLDDDTLARLDRLSEAMSKRAGGATVKRGTALRAVVDHGLAALEAELGLAKRKR